MTLDSDTFSVWISVKPWSATATLADTDFMYLGSGNSYAGTFNYSMGTTGILGRPTSSAISVDGATGPTESLSFNSTRVNPVSPNDSTSDYTNVSNAFCRTTLRHMREAIQMQQGAYIVRLYNLSPRMNGGLTYKPTAMGDPLELPVFLNSDTCTFSYENPNNLNVQVSLTLRNKKVGYAD